MRAPRRLAVALLALAALGTVASPARAGCFADCDGDGHVSSAEVASARGVLMGRAGVTDCGLGDSNRDGSVTVSELLPALGASDADCPIPLDVIGQVVDVDTGEPVVNADVELSSGERGNTDSTGFFSFFDLPADSVVVTVNAAGYAPGARTLTPAPAGGDLAILDLKPLSEPVAIDASAGGKADGTGAAITFPESAFVTGSGEPPAEPVEVSITKLDPLGPDASATPGSFADVEGAAAMDSLGVVQVSLTSGGEDVALATGKLATLAMPVPQEQASSVAPGQEIPLWGFDETTGKWSPAPQPGVVQDDPESPGSYVVQAPVSHFSWWSFGRSFPSITCIAVTVTAGGDPVPGVVVRANGVGFGWTTAGVTDAQGRACLAVLSDRSYRLQARLGGLAFHDLAQVTAPSGLAACGLGSCASFGPFDVPFTACVKGRVTTSTGFGVPRARVVVVPGETVVADASGFYCARVPASRTVRVTTRGHAGVSVRTLASGACDDGTCVRADLRTEIGAGPVAMGVVTAGRQRYFYRPSPSSPAVSTSDSAPIHAMFVVSPDPPPGAVITEDTDVMAGECRIRRRVWEKVYVGQPGIQEPFSGVIFDPGNPGTLTETSTGTQLLLERGNPLWNPPAVDWFQLGWFTYMTNDGLEDFTDDADVTVAFPGGRDIAPFSATQHVPELVTVLEPDLTSPDPFMPRNLPMTVRWAPASTPGVPVTVQFSGGGTQQGMTPEGWGTARTDALWVECTTADDGELVVPVEVMSRFPGGSMFVVRRTTTRRIPVIDRRTNRPATVIFETTARTLRSLPSRLVGP